METPRERSSGTDSDPAAGVERGKFGRIAGHTQGLVEDLREWVDLRLDLALLDLEERIEDLGNELLLRLTLLVLGLFTLLFGLTTLALGLGWVFGRPFWGFLIVLGLLFVFFVSLSAARPNLFPPVRLYEQVRGEGRDSSSATASSDDGGTDRAESGT